MGSVYVAVTTILSLLLIGCAPEPAHPLQGVWKLDRTIDLDTSEIVEGQNTHYVFTERYIMAIGGAQDRPVIEKNFAQMSADEIQSQLPAGGGFMQYSIVDSKIQRTTLFAMSEYFEGRVILTEFEVTEDSLILRDDHWADGHMREWHFSRIE